MNQWLQVAAFPWLAWQILHFAAVVGNAPSLNKFQAFGNHAVRLQNGESLLSLRLRACFCVVASLWQQQLAATLSASDGRAPISASSCRRDVSWVKMHGYIVFAGSVLIVDAANYRVKVIRGVAGETRHAQRVIAGSSNRLQGGVPFPSTNLNALETSLGDVLGLTADTRVSSNTTQDVYFTERVRDIIMHALWTCQDHVTLPHCMNYFAGHWCDSPIVPPWQQQLGHRHHHLPHNPCGAHCPRCVRIPAPRHRSTTRNTQLQP